MNKKSFFALGSLFLVLAFPAPAADDALITRYLNAANDQYSAGNMAKAFSYINIVLNSYTETSVPGNVEVMGETIYYGYLEQIRDSRDYTSFAQVKEKLIAFPFLSSERVSRLVKIVNTYQADSEVLRSAGVSASGASGGSTGGSASNLVELQLALETVRKETSEQNQQNEAAQRQQLLDTQRSAYETALTEVKNATGSGNRILLLVMLALAGIVFVVFLIVVVNLVVSMRSRKTQDERFVETLKAVSQLANMPVAAPAFAALPPSYENVGNMKLIGSSEAGTGLPPGPATQEEHAEFEELAAKCNELGRQIDAVTGRKNNSKNVSELVYKMSHELGYGQYEATLFFMVAMIYDIGFLEIDRNLLGADNLTEEQKYEIRNHVKQGLAQIAFVPERYRWVFADGILMHHENMDGSGYPEGLEGTRIPYVARVLRVAESFVALISRRNYREIFDKESAIDEMKSKPGLYDPKLVTILENII